MGRSIHFSNSTLRRVCFCSLSLTGANLHQCHVSPISHAQWSAKMREREQTERECISMKAASEQEKKILCVENERMKKKRRENENEENWRKTCWKCEWNERENENIFTHFLCTFSFSFLHAGSLCMCDITDELSSIDSSRDSTMILPKDKFFHSK